MRGLVNGLAVVRPEVFMAPAHIEPLLQKWFSQIRLVADKMPRGTGPKAFRVALKKYFDGLPDSDIPRGFLSATSGLGINTGALMAHVGNDDLFRKGKLSVFPTLLGYEQELPNDVANVCRVKFIPMADGHFSVVADCELKASDLMSPSLPEATEPTVSSVAPYINDSFPGWQYLIEEEGTRDVVKIGYTEEEDRRDRTGSTDNHRGLKPIGFFPSNPQIDKAIKRELKPHHRGNGGKEWYASVPASEIFMRYMREVLQSLYMKGNNE